MEIPSEIKLTKTTSKGRKCWIDPQTGEETPIEGAVAGFFRDQGLQVPYNEPTRSSKGDYNAAFSVFLAALMFETYDHKNPEHKDIFEDLVSFGGLRLRSMAQTIRNPVTGETTLLSRTNEHEERLSRASARTKGEIESNLKSLWKHSFKRLKIGRNYFGGDLTPAQMIPRIMLLYKALGVERFVACQRYRVEAKHHEIPPGWPDLAVWNDDDFSFVEVKGPNDKLRPHQRVCIDALNSMEIPAHIVRVIAAE